MALIKCPECQKEVSDTAETCPHCGYRLKPAKRQTTYYYSSRASDIVERDHFIRNVVGIIGGAILIIVGIVFFCICGATVAGTYSEIKTLLIISGIIIIILGVVSILYSVYRLKNY